MKFIGIILLAILTSSMFTSHGQSFYSIRRDRNTILSIGTGTSTYLGELQNPGDYFDAKPNLNVGLQYFLSKRISARAEITWFQLSGTDAKANDDRRERNLSFQSNNYELNFAGLVSLFPNGQRFYQRTFFNVYGFAGVGAMFMNPKAVFNGEKIALQPLQTEGVSYSRFQPVIPLGLGLRIKQGPFFNINIEGGYRMTFTDYLDDISVRRYVDPTTLSSDLARSLADRRVEYFTSIGETFTPTPNVGVRGNPEKKDGYFILNVKLEYYLPYDFSIGKGLSRKRSGNNIRYKKYKPGRRR